jgi:1,4-dihydroxy-2-naphthoate octaprenyltransferase
VNEVKTLSKGAPDFDSYLLGTFSKTHRALPVSTLNANSSRETVTFQIRSLAEIARPSWLIIIIHLLKVRAFVLVLFPIYLILIKNTADGTIKDPVVVLVSTFGILFAYIAVNLRNDYTDHMKGLDRINPQAGSRVIQNGWMTASQVRSWAHTFVIAASMCAAVVIFAFPLVIGVVLLTFMVSIWAQFLKKGSFKYHKGGELFVFLLMGPLLTTGYQISISGFWDKESLYIGILWGWLVVFLQHIKNFEYIMVNAQAGFHNTVTWLGFDKSKTLLKLWWLVFLGFFLAYHYRYSGNFWTWFLGAVLVFCGIPFFIGLNHLHSSVGSDLVRVRKVGYGLVLIALFLWAAENFCYLAPWHSWGL